MVAHKRQATQGARVHHLRQGVSTMNDWIDARKKVTEAATGAARWVAYSSPAEFIWDKGWRLMWDPLYNVSQHEALREAGI
jgi:hypothetical protein